MNNITGVDVAKVDLPQCLNHGASMGDTLPSTYRTLFEEVEYQSRPESFLPLILRVFTRPAKSTPAASIAAVLIYCFTFQHQEIHLFVARKIPKVIQVIHTVVILFPVIENVLTLQVFRNADKRALKIDFLTPPLTSGLALKSALPGRIWGTVDTIQRYWPPGAIPECSIVTALDSTLNSDAQLFAVALTQGAATDDTAYRPVVDN
ncbi:hypothetical protein UY3_05499 [Chelonia mydas]|uniref:Uncharacterized protein n=1 Tax=Chelonia mydas TaxID=8469 RepID=M7BNN8_CHEMY|nr:hypothetical protein UY3_05499 [Chelonia mydas]